MAGKINDIGPAERRIRIIGETYPLLDPAEVAKALGAEGPGTKLEVTLGPISLLAVRQELARRLQSSGGRPALEGVDRRAKIPISDEQWAQLEKIAAVVATPDCAPTAGQVASVLLSSALQAVAVQLSPESKK
jgi:hypothetical protein